MSTFTFSLVEHTDHFSFLVFSFLGQCCKHLLLSGRAHRQPSARESTEPGCEHRQVVQWLFWSHSVRKGYGGSPGRESPGKGDAAVE